MDKNTKDIKATRTSGSGEFAGLLNATESAMPVVATAQLVVASRRVRQILLRYISPLYRWASMPSSAALKAFCCLGFSDALISSPSVLHDPYGLSLSWAEGRRLPDNFKAVSHCASRRVIRRSCSRS